MNSDENIVEKDKLANYHSSVKVSQMCLKGATVKIITVDKCFRYLGYRKKFMFKRIVWKGGIAHCQQLLRLQIHFQHSYVTK